MPLPPRVKDRLFTLLCVIAAAVVLVIGFSRGNHRVALGGAAVFLGYALLQYLARRLTPGARLVVGSEADARERLVQFKATKLAGQVAVGLLVVSLGVSVLWNWSVGLWVAGACSVILCAFIGGLVFFTRQDRRGTKTP